MSYSRAKHPSETNSFSLRKAICTAAYAYHRRRKSIQIKKELRKTHRRCVYAFNELAKSHLSRQNEAISTAKEKYEGAKRAQKRCAELISQCSLKYQTPKDFKWLGNAISIHAMYNVALRYLHCIAYEKLCDVERAYYAEKGLHSLKMYRTALWKK